MKETVDTKGGRGNEPRGFLEVPPQSQPSRGKKRERKKKIRGWDVDQKDKGTRKKKQHSKGERLEST